MTVKARVALLSGDEEVDVLAPSIEDAVRYMAHTFPNGVGFGKTRPVAPGTAGVYSVSVSEALAEAIRADESLVVFTGLRTVGCGNWAALTEAGQQVVARARGRR